MAEYTVKYLDGEEEESVWISRPGKAEVTFPNGHTYVGEFNENKERKQAEPQTRDRTDAVPLAGASRHQGLIDLCLSTDDPCLATYLRSPRSLLYFTASSGGHIF